MQKVYAGFVGENDGFDGPVKFDGPKGWTVDKEQQTEIFTIRHGLKLANPRDLRVVITTTAVRTVANIESMTANDFRVSVWSLEGGGAQTGFSFVAVKKSVIKGAR